MPKTHVQVTDGAWQDDSDDPQSMTRRVVGALDQHLGHSLKDKELTVRFASDEDVRALNLEFRKKDAPTNVLSFPATAMPGQTQSEIGDIILARETVIREAGEQGKSIADHSSHLVLHGVLHLLGYDHDTDETAEEMESLERTVLAGLDIKDPYADETVMEADHGH